METDLVKLQKKNKGFEINSKYRHIEEVV